MTTTVVNLYHTRHFDVYIGRAGMGEDGYFGNPHTLDEFDGDRDKCLAAYETYFLQRIQTDAEFKTKVLALKGKTLGCFCKPKACHGDIIANWLAANDVQTPPANG